MRFPLPPGKHEFSMKVVVADDGFTSIYVTGADGADVLRVAGPERSYKTVAGLASTLLAVRAEGLDQ